MIRFKDYITESEDYSGAPPHVAGIHKIFTDAGYKHSKVGDHLKWSHSSGDQTKTVSKIDKHLAKHGFEKSHKDSKLGDATTDHHTYTKGPHKVHLQVDSGWNQSAMNGSAASYKIVSDDTPVGDKSYSMPYSRKGAPRRASHRW